MNRPLHLAPPEEFDSYDEWLLYIREENEKEDRRNDHKAAFCIMASFLLTFAFFALIVWLNNKH